MKTDEVRKQVDDALEMLGQHLEQGASDQLLAYLSAMAKFHKYSVGNIILLSLQRNDASRVAGYQTWRRLGRQVKKGEKGIAIMAPIVRRRRKEEDEEDKVFAFKTAYVFDVSQTEGKALPEPSRVQGDPGAALHRLKAFVAEQGIELGRLPAIADAEGVSRNGTILIQPGLAPAAEFSVVVHELAHEMLHWGEQEKKPSKTVQETEAEAVAHVVCTAIGLDANTSSSDYIGVYQGNKETLAKSLGRIQRTASRIIEGVTVKADPVAAMTGEAAVLLCREAA